MKRLLYKTSAYIPFLNKRILLFPILWLLLQGALFGQNNITSIKSNPAIDSLLILIKKDKADTNKVNHVCQLVDELRKNSDIEKGLEYATEGLLLSQKLNFKKGTASLYFLIGKFYLVKGDYSQTLDYYHKALVLYQELYNKKQTAICLMRIGGTYTMQGNYQLSLEYMQSALKINEEIGNQEEQANCMMNIGTAYLYMSNHQLALNYFYKALKLYEASKNYENMALCIGNIGTVYSYQNDYKKALEYYFKALKIARITGNKDRQIQNLINIGSAYDQQNNFSTALENYFKAKELIEETQDQNSLIVLYTNIGRIYTNQNNTAEAFKYYNKALAIIEKSGDLNNKAVCFSNIAELYYKKGNFREAEKYIKNAIAIADSIGSLDNLTIYEQFISKVYDTTGQYKQALLHYKTAKALQDTLYSQENKKELVKKELTYEFDKKEAVLKAENEKQQAIAAQKNIIIWLVTAGLLLVFIFAILAFRSLRITRKQKYIIELQRNEVSKQKEIADSQRIIAEELRAVAEKQKEVVQEKQKEIVDSITYAKRIQTALLTSDNYIREHLPAEHFILFKPKDIVSGDFYWALSIAQLPGWDLGTNNIKLAKSFGKRNTFYLITADCTGHGVPGAFMSMLNISYLNENVIERAIRLPHDILNAQRKEIIQALNPQGSKEESKDGMDCVLCAYDFDKMLLHFAAANSSLWQIRDGELTEYKGDKMPVGKYNEVIKPFTLQTIELQKGDIIYTSTDGFADQFGNNGKKMMKKRFKEELLKIHHLPVNEQKEHLDKYFENWKGKNEQVDDVCIVGVKI